MSTDRDAERDQLAAALRERRDNPTATGDREHNYRPGAPCMDCGDYPGPRHEDSDCPRAVARALLPVVDRIANERAAAELEAAAKVPVGQRVDPLWLRARADALRAAQEAVDANGCPDRQHHGVDCPGDACRFAAAPTPPEVVEARVVEEVARAMYESSYGGTWDLTWEEFCGAPGVDPGYYRRLAAAAVVAYRAAQDGGAEHGPGKCVPMEDANRALYVAGDAEMQLEALSAQDGGAEEADAARQQKAEMLRAALAPQAADDAPLGCGVTGCQTCGDYGMKQDPVAHGESDEFVRCPDCGCLEPPSSAFCWRCGAGLEDVDDPS